MKRAVVVVKRSIRTVLFTLAVRIFVYALLLGGLAYGMLWGAVVYDEAFYDELGPVEILETVFALSASLVFLLAGRKDPSKTPCAVMISGLLFCVFVRESDYILDTFVLRHSWKIGIVLILLWMATYAARHFRDIYMSVLKFTHLPSFGIFMSGLLVLVVFSRLFGYGPFWKAIMDDPSYRTVKTIVEEGVEQMGYFLAFISACEYWHEARMHTRFAPKATE